VTVRDRPLVFLFGGQGSQYYQMGRELFRENATFRRWMEHGDRLVAARTGFSLINELYAAHRRPGDPFDDFEVSHPSLFLFQYALARTFIEEGVRPDVMLGVSLGEVVACALLDVFDFETALTSVTEQARSIVRAAPRGGLISILAPRDVFEDSPLLRSHCEISGDFAPQHFVLACPHQNLGEVEAYVRSRDVLHVVLPVHHPFHSRWMEPLRRIPGCVMDGTPFGRPTADFVSCTEAARLRALAPDHFWWTLRKPIAFRASIRLLEDAGACRYVDLTPAGTLAHLARANFAAGSGSESHAVNSPFGRDAARWKGVAAILRGHDTSYG
jgi:acyl transferase domain-containing protein